MADVSKIKVENVTYDIKDSTARENIIYSSSTQTIGKWTDNRNIYRKIYSINKSTSEVAIEQIPNLDIILRCDTYLNRTDNYKNINNFYGGSSDYGSTYVDTNNYIKYSSSHNGTLTMILEYIETI